MIDFINVSKRYDNGTQALKNVNIHIEQGEFVFVVGSSGAGKSTFLKILMREEVPSSGTVIVNGKTLNDLKKREIPYFRRDLGIVFQDFRLIPNMTVYENIAFAMRVIGARESEIRKKVPFVITRVGLSNKARCFPNELSGGEQQRVALARALVNEAKVIIADEPTGNIDPTMAFEIVDLLKDINEKGTTVIMVTHEHDLVRQFEKRVITLDGGNVVADGDLETSPLVKKYVKTYNGKDEKRQLRRMRKKSAQAYYPDEDSVEDLSRFMETMTEEQESGHTNEIDVDEIYNNLENNKYSVYLDDSTPSEGAGNGGAE
ncbi:MAG: cell division ATP-binding protein FtsE [Ruminococcaceae bacterium]|nr:cell division ATP-binding protein FtsE [Oscillospiraceae bacterium]